MKVMLVEADMADLEVGLAPPMTSEGFSQGYLGSKLPSNPWGGGAQVRLQVSYSKVIAKTSLSKV